MKNKILYLENPASQKEAVSFRSNIEISEETLDLLRKKGRQYGLESIQPFNVKDIVTAQWVNLKCRYGCPHYRANWSCPPATPDFDEVKTILNEYTTALLIEGSQKRADFYKNSIRNRTDQVKYWKVTVSLERLLFLKGYDKAVSLVSGACFLCKKCAYPEACKFPKEKRPTVESFYIDLVGTLKNLGIDTKVAYELNETFKYYSIILLD